jgi:hypothetical protein
VAKSLNREGQIANGVTIFRVLGVSQCDEGLGWDLDDQNLRGGQGDGCMPKEHVVQGPTGMIEGAE